MNEGLFRLRVKYVKHGRLRYLGHLEVLGTIDRCVRRSGLPFDVTNGFSPRMRMQFSSALPVGVASDCEWYDLYLREEVDTTEALDLLRRSSPADLAPARAGYVVTSLPAIEAWLTRMDWSIDINRDVSAAELDGACRAVWDAGSIAYMRGRKEKVVDLTRTLVGWELADADEGGVSMSLHTRAMPTGSLRPGLLVATALAALGAESDSASYSVCRRAQWAEVDGRLVEPLG